MTDKASKKKNFKGFKRSNEIGIDLGTANTLVFRKHQGIVLKEPTIVAVDLRNGRILAVGQEAKKMLGKAPGHIKVIRPMRKGAIADFDTTREMLKYFMSKVGVLRPKVIISVPFGTTSVEKRAVIEAAMQAGAKDTYLIEEPLAAAIGANLPVEEASGNMVINIGGGTTEIAVISLGGIVNGRSVRIGGDAFDEAIRNYLRKKYRMEIGQPTAERIKIAIGYAVKVNNPQSYDAKGIDLKTGLPTSKTISTNELAEVLLKPLDDLITAAKEVFEEAPPQLASDIIEKGIVLTGGGANLGGLDRLIEKNLKLPVQIADNPQECVARGTGEAIMHLKTLTGMSLYHI